MVIPTWFVVESLHRSFVSPMMVMMLLMGPSVNYNFLMSSFQQTILGTPSLLLKWWCRFYTGQSYRLVLAVTNGISKTASLHCVVFSWLGFLSCESGTDIVPCEFRIVVVESSYNRCFLADINVDLLWYVKATFHYWNRWSMQLFKIAYHVAVWIRLCSCSHVVFAVLSSVLR